MDTHVPYWKMSANNDLIPSKNAYCLAKPGEIYAIYLPEANNALIDFQSFYNEWDIRWYDPRNGGQLQNGAIHSTTGHGIKALGDPPSAKNKDWVVLVTKRNN